MEISEFYDGKSILITGVTGLVGGYLLEVLLRCFPGIVRVYILVRSRKGLNPQQRLESVYKKKLFVEALKKNPKVFEKVRLVEGDVSKPNLGFSAEDLKTITEEVNIVFHCAATISFRVPYRFISQRNAKGTENVIDVCKMIKNLDILVYTSTCYCNSHILPERSEEKVYPMPYSAQIFLDEIQNGNDESFEKLVSSLNTKYGMKWPNSYTFSKCLAENVLLEKTSDITVAIVRPSIICWALKGTLPGYYEEGSILADLTTGVLRGYLKVTHMDPDIIWDITAIDAVVNTHIVTAWVVATGRRPSMYVVNCASGNEMRAKLGDVFGTIADLGRKNMAPNTIQEASPPMHIKSKPLYSLLSFYMHTIPAALLDLYHSYNGIDFRVAKHYEELDKRMVETELFLINEFPFATNNYESLSYELQPKEKEIFYTNYAGATLKEYVHTLPIGSEFYNWDKDKLSPSKRESLVQTQTMVLTFIRRFAFLLTIIILYFIIFKIFL